MSDRMADPAPENITGEKVEKHVFSHDVQHKVNWGHVSLGVAVVVLVWVVSRWYQNREDDDESSVVDDATEVMS